MVFRPEMRSNCMKSTITMFVSVVVVDSCSCNHLETALSQRLATEDLIKKVCYFCSLSYFFVVVMENYCVQA